MERRQAPAQHVGQGGRLRRPEQIPENDTVTPFKREHPPLLRELAYPAMNVTFIAFHIYRLYRNESVIL